MSSSIGTVTFLVREYDESLVFFTRVLGFRCLEDRKISEEKRWVVVAPQGNRGCALLLARAKNESEINAIGHQAGGRVFLFLRTYDFWRDYNLYSAKGVVFCGQPRHEPYGIVAVFVDLYGNRWDLLEEISDRK